ncbi:DUF6380 family protein [Streptomyces sp. NPDC050416]|uniref:DUF6380 family protein n=1 Tax=Streptomyces sp. NPDC050416 TaxID=3365611 RepID=UPI0037ABF7F5
MTDGLIQGEATTTRPVGAGPRCRTAPRSTTPHARQARHETEPTLSPARRRGSAPVAGAGTGRSARVTSVAERGCDVRQSRHESEPVLSLVRRRRRVGVGSGGLAGVTPAAERGHGASSGHTVGDKRRATLRRGVASLTETVGRASFERYGRRAGEGAR